MSALPVNASVAHAGQGARLSAPSALRNAPVLSNLLQEAAPLSGRALEIASGTGEQITRFAATFPLLDWHPTEIDRTRLASIDAYRSEAALPNLRPARRLDACAPDWSRDEPPSDLILLVNLLHLVSENAARTVLTEAARALASDGVFVIYGPFRRSGKLSSEGDMQFDADLRAADPQIGYKDDQWMRHTLTVAGLTVKDVRDMPSNNLAFIAEKGKP